MTETTTFSSPLIAAVQHACAAVLAATTPEQYREAELALIDAGFALEDRVWARHQWLIRNDEKLDEYELTLPPAEVKAKEAIYLVKLEEYEEWFRVLAHVLTIVALPVPVTPEAPAMTQGGLL